MTHNVEEETPRSSDVLPHTLPPGLVGPRCVSTDSVDDISCQSILETGSQVTTISETFCHRNLTSFPIQPIHHLLEVEGAGGQLVPYLGYVEVPFTFPDSVTGAEEQLTALALVVPEETRYISLCCLHNIETELFMGYMMKLVILDLSVC